MDTLDQSTEESSESKNKMFQNVFSFDGRIRRTEYCLSLVIIFVIEWIALKANSNAPGFYLLIRFIFLYPTATQGAKRCHDVDKSGWWQCLPFFFLYLLFAKGTPGENEYGENPKGEMLQQDTKVQLNQTSVQVYSLPELSSEVIATLNNKDTFILCINNSSSSADWDLIKLSNQQSGYIDAKTKVLIAEK